MLTGPWKEEEEPPSLLLLPLLPQQTRSPHLFYQAIFAEVFELTACIFSEIVTSQCPSSAVINVQKWSSGELSVETIDIYGICQMFLFKFAVTTALVSV
jgi:hypothetical protein